MDHDKILNSLHLIMLAAFFLSSATVLAIVHGSPTETTTKTSDYREARQATQDCQQQGKSPLIRTIWSESVPMKPKEFHVICH